MGLTVFELVKHDFREHSVPPYKENCSRFFQKTVRTNSGRGIAYFINVYMYDLSKFSISLDNAIEAESQLNMHCPQKATFNANLLHPESVEQLENFFYMVYTNLNCIPYERG